MKRITLLLGMVCCVLQTLYAQSSAERQNMSDFSQSHGSISTSIPLFSLDFGSTSIPIFFKLFQ